MTFEFNQEQLDRILGRGIHQPKQKYVCFLPFRGEFGWYLMTYVKRVHGYNHGNKIVCARSGHECLFPTAHKFYEKWQDCEDRIKAGIVPNDDEETIKQNIIEMLGTDDIHFLSPSETSWEEKMSMHNHTFIPQSLRKLGLKTDIVITPRKRVIDSHRNWTQENWQIVVDELKEQNITVGVCGAADSSFHLDNVLYKSYDYVDVDSDIELMNNAKLVITQESGLQYLSFLCERPTFCIDHYHKDFGSDLHRNLDVPFKNIPYVWGNPKQLVEEIISFLKEQNDSGL